MILTSRKFGSALISGILGQLVHQAFETLAGGRHRLPQVQSFGFSCRHLVFQYLVLGAQLVDQGDDLFNLGFESLSSVFMAGTIVGKTSRGQGLSLYSQSALSGCGGIIMMRRNTLRVRIRPASGAAIGLSERR